MGFRKPKSDDRARLSQWQSWIDNNRDELKRIGFPPEVYLTVDHWEDFLENGHLHWHESSGFQFADLSTSQMAALRRFLENEYQTSPTIPVLLSWLRLRLDDQ